MIQGKICHTNKAVLMESRSNGICVTNSIVEVRTSRMLCFRGRKGCSFSLVESQPEVTNFQSKLGKRFQLNEWP